MPNSNKNFTFRRAQKTFSCVNVFMLCLNFATITVVITFNNFSFQIDSSYLWGILALFLVVFAIMSAVLRFHWNNYSAENSSRVFIKSLFWSVSLALLISATISLLVFEVEI